MKTTLFVISCCALGMGAFGCSTDSHSRQMAEGSATVPTSAEQIQPLTEGSMVPPLTLEDSSGQPLDLRQAVRKQPAVLIFYRGGWCPYCNTHLGQLQGIESRLGDLGYQVLAISPDRPEHLAESEEKQDLDYSLLSDSKMRAAKAFGVAFRVDDETIAKYKDYGIDLEAASGESHHLLPVPSVFIVGTDGVVRFAHADPNYKVRIEPETLVTAARAAL
jgi:peroxiredoxin